MNKLCTLTGKDGQRVDRSEVVKERNQTMVSLVVSRGISVEIKIITSGKLKKNWTFWKASTNFSIFLFFFIDSRNFGDPWLV